MGKASRAIYHAVIPLRCRVKPRPRVKGGGTYMPKGYVEWRGAVRFELVARNAEPQLGPLRMALVIRFKAKGRGDADNLAGGVMDAANGVLYEDDSQIEQLDVRIERNTGEDEIEVTLWRL